MYSTLQCHLFTLHALLTTQIFTTRLHIRHSFIVHPVARTYVVRKTGIQNLYLTSTINACASTFTSMSIHCITEKVAKKDDEEAYQLTSRNKNTLRRSALVFQSFRNTSG